LPWPATPRLRLHDCRVIRMAESREKYARFSPQQAPSASTNPAARHPWLGQLAERQVRLQNANYTSLSPCHQIRRTGPLRPLRGTPCLPTHRQLLCSTSLLTSLLLYSNQHKPASQSEGPCKPILRVSTAATQKKLCYTHTAVLRHDSIPHPGGKSVNASPSKLYRIASGLLLLFAIGHTVGFRQTDPRWGVDSLVASMRTIRFDVQGSSRTYWDFFVGTGFTVGVFLLFAAVLAWQLGGLRRQTLRDLPVVTWALAIVFVGVTVLSWMYLFIIPVIFSALISLCLIIAAWLAGKQGREQA
jgi:hypothetical protein